MSQQASVGKPPRQEQPPPSLSTSYRKIYIEPEPTETTTTETITAAQFGRDYDIRDLGKLSFEHPELFKAQFGRDYDIRDLGKISYEHPEYFRQVKQTAPRLERDIMAGKYGKTAIWEFMETKIPKGTELTSIGETSKGLELTYTMPTKEAPEYSVGEVWLQGYTLEDIRSSLFFRNLWDPEYKKDLARRQAEFRASHDMPTIQRMQTEQGTFAVSVAVIAFSAYDIGRSLYHIAKWGGAKGPAMVDLTSKELQEEPFTYTAISGPKGARTVESASYVPKPPEPEVFEITSTRGAWSKKPIVSLVESEKASSTLPQLLLWPTQTQVQIPLGLYEPRFLSEAVFSGMAIGSLLTPASRTEAISRTLTIQKPQLGLKASQFSMSGIMQNLETQQSQQVAQAQSQRLQLKSLQSQRLLTVQKEFGFEPLRKQRKRKGSDPFGLFGRYKREYPIMTAKQVMGLKPKKGKLF